MEECCSVAPTSALDDVAGTANRFSIYDRVAGQLDEARLGRLSGRYGVDDLQTLTTSPSATAYMDLRSGHINVIQDWPKYPLDRRSGDPQSCVVPGLMMLEVLNLDGGAALPEVSGDEHVPLMVRWGLTAAVVWQAVWPDGRLCCEVKISRVGGRISGVTVLNPPPVMGQTEVCSGAWEDAGVPVVSLAPFDPNPDLVPQRDVAEFRCSPTAVRSGEWVVFRFGDPTPVRWAVSGSAGFGIDDLDQLVAVRVLASALPQSSPLAV